MVCVSFGLCSHLLLLLLLVAGQGATLAIGLGTGSTSCRPLMQAKLAFVALIDCSVIVAAEKG